ncbi:hypothetical protein NC651_037070 [Populus alba x Populus x berolinensis]|nr:hypothetical protein NC651_037070 [Populus alba x Populus x berolinensis]
MEHQGKLMKPGFQVEARKEDRISQLPDRILSIILSRLPMKDLVKTSALSNRWKHLWALRTNLNFDVDGIFGTNHERPDCSSKHSKHYEEFKLEFARCVDGFLQNFQGTKVISFKLHFLKHLGDTSNINRWISSVIGLGIEELELILSGMTLFSYYHHGLLGDEYYSFPYWLLPHPSDSRLKHLHLRTCVLKPPADFIGFNKLITLQLHDVFLGEEFLASLFSNCLLLQGLMLIRCKHMSLLKVFSTSLQNLVLLDCSNPSPVKVIAVNLTDFEYSGDIMKITVFVAPCLVKIYFNFNSIHVIDMPNALSHCATFPTLQTLILHLDPWKEKRLPQSMDSLKNLKQLELFYIRASKVEDLLWVLTYLNACPLLEKLDITLSGEEFHKNQREMRDICGCTYSRLKKVRMNGFNGNWFEMELITHILKSATSLDQVVISPLALFYLGGGEWSRFTPDESWHESRQDVVRKSLQENAPAGVHLVVL